MNIRAKVSILSFILLAGGGLLLQSCQMPNLKPQAVAKTAPCGLGSAYAGEIVIGLGDSGTIEGTTSGRPNEVSTLCLGAGQHPDAVYKLVVEDPVNLTMDLCPDSPGCPSFGIWEDCPGESSLEFADCAPGCVAIANSCVPPGTYYLAIEAHPECSPPATFDFTIAFSAASLCI